MTKECYTEATCAHGTREKRLKSSAEIERSNAACEARTNRTLPRRGGVLPDAAKPVHARRTARRHFPEQDCCRPRVYCETGGDSFVASGWYEYYMPLPVAQALGRGPATRLCHMDGASDAKQQSRFADRPRVWPL